MKMILKIGDYFFNRLAVKESLVPTVLLIRSGSLITLNDGKYSGDLNVDHLS